MPGNVLELSMAQEGERRGAFVLSACLIGTSGRNER